MEQSGYPLGKRIAERRRAMGICEESLSIMVSITRQQLHEIEAGRLEVSADLWLKLSKALQVDSTYLLTGSSWEEAQRPVR